VDDPNQWTRRIPCLHHSSSAKADPEDRVASEVVEVEDLVDSGVVGAGAGTAGEVASAVEAALEVEVEVTLADVEDSAVAVADLVVVAEVGSMVAEVVEVGTLAVGAGLEVVEEVTVDHQVVVSEVEVVDLAVTKVVETHMGKLY